MQKDLGKAIPISQDSYDNRNPSKSELHKSLNNIGRFR